MFNVMERKLECSMMYDDLLDNIAVILLMCVETYQLEVTYLCR